MKLNFLFLIILSTVFFSGCKKAPQDVTTRYVKSSQKELLKFSFLRTDNPNLSSDITGNISGNKVVIVVPPGASKSIIATFSSSDKSKVYIGTTEQKSGTTSNDFTNTVDYKVVAEDSSVNVYSVNVTYQKSSRKELSSFVFLKITNPSLPSDIIGSISGTSVSVIIPPGTSRNLVPTFTNSDKSHVYIGVTEQQSGITRNDFSNTINYKIIAEDSSSIIYPVSVTTDTFTELDNTIKDAMNQNDIPGLSIAIVKNEKLVYVNTYGYADKEAMEPVNPNSVFRIASVSKPITAIAILKLLQDGILTTLDAKVFGANGILNDYGTPPAGSKIDQITIRQLIDHTSGWTNEPNDIMFNTTATDFKDIIKYIVENTPLKYNPGEQYNYLNFGYCVLGRIIERFAGISYEQYVKTAILQPCGITEMRIGNKTLAERLPNEVKYYNPLYSPYWLNIPLYDAFGGWVASPTDLLRFMVKIDRNNYVPDILTSATLSQLYFGSNWGHYGQFQGVSSALFKIDDNYSVAFIENHDIGEENFKLYDKIKQIILQRINWPTYDLF